VTCPDIDIYIVSVIVFQVNVE